MAMTFAGRGHLQQEHDDALDVYRLDRATIVVQRRGRSARWGSRRVQLPASGSASPTGAQGDHHGLFDGRPLPLATDVHQHGRLRSELENLTWGSVLMTYNAYPPDPELRWRSAARHVA